MKYHVTFEKTWIEHGEVEIEADTADDAEAIALEMLTTGDDAIAWHSDNMDPQGEYVASVQEMEDD